MNICEVCKKPAEECTCCPECSHICSLDYGELYCPVCLPEKDPDKRFMRLALKEAEKAVLKGEVPVGAVLVKDNSVIALTHNTRETQNDPAGHAELLALREGAFSLNRWRLTDLTLYVTKEPCVMCAGAMVNARLGRLVYGCEDTKAGAVNNLYQVLSDKRLNHQVKVVSGVMKEECSSLLKEFFKNRRDEA